MSPLLRGEFAACQLVNERTGKTVVTELLTAFDSATRNKGLLGHSHLDPRTALVIAPCTSIHTFFMKFPIDVAFMSSDGRVLKVRARVAPWRVALCLRGHSVIEFASGVLDAADVRSGDRLHFSPRRLA